LSNEKNVKEIKELLERKIGGGGKQNNQVQLVIGKPNDRACMTQASKVCKDSF